MNDRTKRLAKVAAAAGVSVAALAGAGTASAAPGIAALDRATVDAYLGGYRYLPIRDICTVGICIDPVFYEVELIPEPLSNGVPGLFEIGLPGQFAQPGQVR